MLFADKLKNLRIISGLTQDEIADVLGVSLRTYWNYEAGRMYPKNTALYGKLAKLFNVTVDYMISEENQYNFDIPDNGVIMDSKGMKRLTREFRRLFNGKELSQEEKDKAMMLINEFYWTAKKQYKETNTPKKRG